MNKRLLAVPAALVAALLAVGTASAWPAGSVSVETNACAYTIHVDLDRPGALIGWEVRVFADVPLNGALVASGSGTISAQGHFQAGPFQAQPGTYNAIIDDTVPVDAAAEIIPFTLTCTSETSTTTSTTTSTASETSSETSTTTTTDTSTVTSTATSTETSTPTSTSTSTSTTTPTGAELGETGTPPSTPTGQELGVVGTPAATPPPTDTASFVPAPLNDWRAVLIAFAGLIGAISWLVRIPATAAVRKRNR